MAFVPGAIVISSDISFSTDSSSDDESSFESVPPMPTPRMPTPRRGNLTIRGPGVIGKEPFDDYCIFANKMLLDRNNITNIEKMVDDYGWYPINFYLYKLNPSTVAKNGKMEFGEDFTKAYLNQYLPTTNVSISVRVNSPEYHDRYDVLMKLVLGKKKSIITTGWYNIVKSYDLEEDEVVSFHFWECRKGDLHLSIMHI